MEVEVEVREGQELLEALDGSDKEVFLVVLQLSSSSVGNVFPSNFVSASLGRVWSERLAAWLVTDLVLKFFETTALLLFLVSFVLLLPGVFFKLYLCSVLDLSLVSCLLPLAVLMLLSVSADLILTCF